MQNGSYYIILYDTGLLLLMYEVELVLFSGAGRILNLEPHRLV